MSQQEKCILKLKHGEYIPKNYTGIVEWEGGVKEWYKEGELHREDGPAIEWVDGPCFWCIDGVFYDIQLKDLIKESLFLGVEIGKYGLKWLLFMKETGIEEFPIIPGMKNYDWFSTLFRLLEQTKTATTP